MSWGPDPTEALGGSERHRCAQRRRSRGTASVHQEGVSRSDLMEEATLDLEEGEDVDREKERGHCAEDCMNEGRREHAVLEYEGGGVSTRGSK